MGESVRILAVMPKQKDQEEMLENIVQKLEDSIKFTVTKTKFNHDPEFDIYDKIVQLLLEFEFKTKKYSLHLEKRTFSDENVIVELSILTNEESMELADDLYQLKLMTKIVINSLFKGVYWQKDTQNEKVCSQLYSSIHVLENRFREVIVNFMVNKFGLLWTKKITTELVQKIQLYSKWYRDNYQDFKSVQTDIFNLQINDLISLLVSAYEKQPVSEEDFLKSILADGLDTEAKVQLIEEYKKNSTIKNVWEEYFVEVLGEEFPNDWEFLKNTRNMVAHNKPICSKLYNDTKDVVAKIMDVFDGVEDKFNNMFTTHEQNEIETLWILQANQEMRDQYEEIYLTEAGIELPPSDEEVIEEITEHNKFQQLITIPDDYISSYHALIDETMELLENASENLDFSNEKLLLTKINLLIDLLQSIEVELPWKEEDKQIDDSTSLDTLSDCWYELNTSLENHMNNLLAKIEESSYNDVLCLDAMLISLQNHDSILEVAAHGYLGPEMGSSDSITIILSINSDKIAFGDITKYYGDYEIEDTGAAITTQNDDLLFDISEVLKELSQFAAKSIDYIISIRDEICEIIQK